MKLLSCLTTLTLVFSITAYADNNKSKTENAVKSDVQTLKVSGVHCGSCIKTIREELCKPGAFADCNVKMLNAKKQIGEIQISPNSGQTIDLEKIKAQVHELGYEVK